MRARRLRLRNGSRRGAAQSRPRLAFPPLRLGTAARRTAALRGDRTRSAREARRLVAGARARSPVALPEDRLRKLLESSRPTRPLRRCLMTPVKAISALVLVAGVLISGAAEAHRGGVRFGFHFGVP